MTASGARRRSLLGLSVPEILVILMVVGTLAAIAIPLYAGEQRGAKDVATEADALELSTAIRGKTDRGNIPSVEKVDGWFLLNGGPSFEASPGVELVTFTARSPDDWCLQLTHPDGDRARDPGIRYEARVDEVETGTCQ